MKKIAFFGATGMLGKPVLKEFIKNGYEVTALTRDLEKARSLFPNGVVWVEGDLKQSDKVDETVKGADVVYANLSVKPESKEKDFQAEREGIGSILRAAKWNDVSRIAFVSSIVKFYEGMNGFSWWAFQMKLQAVDKIKRSGIPYIIFNPSSFMENYSEGGFVEGQNIMIIGKSKYPNWFIAADDFAKMAIKAIESTDDDDDKEFIIQGPEGLTLDKAASIYVNNFSPSKLKLVNYSLSLLKFLGIFNSKYQYGAKIIEALNNYPETFVSEEVWDILGKPQITFKEFIQSKNKKQKDLEQEIK